MCGIICLTLWVPVTYLSGYHIWLVRHNMTTYQHILMKREKKGEQMDEETPLGTEKREEFADENDEILQERERKLSKPVRASVNMDEKKDTAGRDEEDYTNIVFTTPNVIKEEL